MASLFLGRRLGAAGFARPVAIKMIHPHLAQDPEFTEMFVAEALLSARIQHPNVVHVEHLGEIDGHYYLVMELVDGCSLGQIQRELQRLRRRLVPHVAVSIAMHVASGLHAAHETKDESGEPLGVVHRDVSPANVLISRAGQVKLIDFGIAKCRQTRVASVSGLIKGKLRYLSPEQALGEEVDRRTDVYALAMVLWELLTGQRLLTGATDLMVLRHAQSPRFESPRAHAPEIAPALEDVIMRALSIDAAARHPTALAFRAALAEAFPEAASLDVGALAQLVAIAGDDPERPPVLAELTAERVEANVVSADEAIHTMTLDLVAVPPREVPAPSGATVSAAPSSPRRRGSRIGLALAVGAIVTIGGGALAWLTATGSTAAPATRAQERDEVHGDRAMPAAAQAPGDVQEAAPAEGAEAAAPPEPAAVGAPLPEPSPETTAEPNEPSERDRVRRRARRSRTRTATMTRSDPRRDVQVVDGVPVAPPPF